MSLEKSRPAIVSFDGLHRTGKGTQAELLSSAIASGGGKSLIVRGDGTREGLGLHDGDPYSEEWQRRGARLKSPEGGSVEAWNAASYLLLRELNDHLEDSATSSYDAIIVDRSLISRAAFLLHRGIGLEGKRLTLAELYPDNEEQPPEKRIDLRQTVPDVIFDLQAQSAQKLLDRLKPHDPKYTFRARNIRGGFRAAQLAADHLPIDVQNRVITLDALQEPDVIHRQVRAALGSAALLNRLA